MGTQTDCPGDDALKRLISGAAGREAEGEWERHIGDCPVCQERLGALSGSAEVPLEVLQATLDLPCDAAFEACLSRLQETGAGWHRSPTGGDLPGADGPDDYSGILAPPLRPGLLGMLGDYEIEEKLAAGGMGIVFRARDPVLGRAVAVKVLKSTELSAGTDGRQRFVREARAAAALDHENIVPIFHFDDAARSPYLVMPLLGGGTLEDLMQERKAPLSAHEIEDIIRQAASGLAAAHDRGLVHRDIKPANLMWEAATGRVRIADFGLATLLGDSSLTRSGMLTGTPLFMSPEQAGDQPIDARSDLFSLGSVLYYLATGTLPFTGTGPLAVLKKVRDEEPVAVRSLNPDVPPWLDELISRLMMKDPADRPQSAEEVLTMLDRQSRPAAAGNVEELGREEAGSRWWKSRAAAVIGVTALVVAAAISAKLMIPPESVITRQSGVASFLGEDGTRVFGDLESVIAQVPDGGVVDIMSAGPHVVSSTIPVKTAMTIRPAPGVLPRFDSEVTVFASTANLELQGLRFVTNSSETLISVERADSFRATHCSFIGNALLPPRGPGGKGSKNRPCLIECFGVGDVSIEHTEMSHPEGGVRLRADEHDASAPQPWRLRLADNTLGLGSAVTAPVVGRGTIELEHNLVSVATHVVSLNEAPALLNRPPGRVKLILRKNICLGRGPYFAFSNRRVVDSVDATFDSNTWGIARAWSGATVRPAPGEGADELATFDHAALMRLLDTVERDWKRVPGRYDPKDLRLRTADEVLRGLPRSAVFGRRGPQLQALGAENYRQSSKETPGL